MTVLKQTKNLAFILLLALTTGFITQGEYAEVISTLSDNDIIKKIKEQFIAHQKERPEDRVYLQFDKPFYNPGETIWFSAYVRNAQTMKASKQSGILHVEFISPKGTKDKEFQVIVKEGQARADITLNEQIAGGLYKVRAFTNWQKNDADPLIFEKEIQVQQVVLPRLKMKLDFERKAYGAGDEVEATLDLQSLSNEALANHEFKFIASLKGNQLLAKKGKTTSKGKANLRFKLPKELTTSDGLLNVMITYNGQTESISRAIPITLNNLAVSFFPEGGDLVAGLESRVAFRVLNEFGKPADISGVLYDDAHQEITKFSSFHQGMGAFSFTPKEDKFYYIEITQPFISEETYELPEVLPAGYQMTKTKQNERQLSFDIQSTVNEELSVMAQVRGKVCYSNSFKVTEGTRHGLNIDTKGFPMGVAQVTLFDSKGIERAERLVFVNKQDQLQIDIKTDKEKYQPREKVNMTITVRDQRGIPMPAQLSLAVTDDKVVSFADDKQGHILSKLLLEPDLKSKVEEPNFYFDETEPKANEALDYLMMTQGWRRFEWKQLKDDTEFNPKFAAERSIIKGRVFGIDGQPSKNTEVVIVDPEQSTMTDSEGWFYFKNYDLYHPVWINANKGETKGSFLISSYQQDAMIYLADMRVKEMAFDDGWGGEMLEEEVLNFEAAPQPVFKAKVRKKRAEAKKVVRVEKLAKKEENEKPLAVIEEKNKMLGDVKDLRFANAADKLDRRRMDEQAVSYYRAREFAAPVYDQATQPETRTDFRSTVFWKGNIEVDQSGKSEVSFYNSDAITSFRATAEGVGIGLVGRKEHTYYTQLPFSMDVKVPVEVMMGDVVRVPVSLSNHTNKALKGQLEITAPAGWKLQKQSPAGVNLAPNKSTTQYLSFSIQNVPSKGKLAIKFDNGEQQDAFEQEVKIVAKGFPVSISQSGDQLKATHQVTITKPVQGTIAANVTAYPTALSDMLAGIESILREPSGCFEQTSSSTYPNIMVMQYLQEYEVEDSKLMARADQLIAKGYKRLVSFETSTKGYEWFGGSPGHEALTAYGLMEFADMSKVYGKVDQGMMQRTANWLFSRRDGKGGFARNARALDSFGRANDAITNAYIIYALSEAGYAKEIETEVAEAVKLAFKEEDPYQMALVANTLFNIKHKKAKDLLAKLNKLQKEDGHFNGSQHSVTRSTGQALKIETTALSILANLKADATNSKIINSATKYIMNNRSAYGGYGNTQSTIMALKALTEFAKFAKRTAESGDIEVLVDGNTVADVHFDKGQQGAIVIDGLEKYLITGENKVEVRYKNTKKALPYTLAVNYSTHLPQSSEACSLKLNTSLASKKVKMGETVRFTTELRNTTKEGLPMSIAIVGIPGGLSPQPWQLKELQEKSVFDYYEVIGSNVVFYYRQLAPSETKTIHLDLKADITGSYAAAASSAYLYYTSEHKTWVKGEQVNISQ